MCCLMVLYCHWFPHLVVFSKVTTFFGKSGKEVKLLFNVPLMSVRKPVMEGQRHNSALYTQPEQSWYFLIKTRRIHQSLTTYLSFCLGVNKQCAIYHSISSVAVVVVHSLNSWREKQRKCHFLSHLKWRLGWSLHFPLGVTKIPVLQLFEAKEVPCILFITRSTYTLVT